MANNDPRVVSSWEAYAASIQAQVQQIENDAMTWMDGASEVAQQCAAADENAHRMMIYGWFQQQNAIKQQLDEFRQALGELPKGSETRKKYAQFYAQQAIAYQKRVGSVLANCEFNEAELSGPNTPKIPSLVLWDKDAVVSGVPMVGLPAPLIVGAIAVAVIALVIIWYTWRTSEVQLAEIQLEREYLGAAIAGHKVPPRGERPSEKHKTITDTISDVVPWIAGAAILFGAATLLKSAKSAATELKTA